MKIKRAHLRRAFAKRSVAVVGVAAVVSSLYKPFIVTAQTIRNVTSCTWSPGYKVQSFVLDSIYGSLITVVPFVIMLGLNVAIYRKLRHRPRFGTGSCCSYRPEIFTKERSIRLEFTAILLFVSAVFILLNVPFLIAWCRNFALELVDLYPRSADFAVSEKGRAWLRMTKTIFYTNYAIHFFIYCFYGAYFRCQLLRHVTCCLGVWQDRSPKYVLRQLNSQTSFNTINA